MIKNPKTTHLPDINGLPLCGSRPQPHRLKDIESRPRTGRLSYMPTCKWCKQIQAGKRKPADPRDTAAKYGRKHR